MLILKIIGIIALIVVAVVVLGAIWFWRMVVKGADTKPYPPCRISLTPEETPAWHHEGQVNKVAAELRAAGFADEGIFTVPETGLHVMGFVNVPERFYACIYDWKELGAIFDICTELPNNAELTGTNSTMGASMDTRPEDIKLGMAKASVKEVLDALRAHPRAAERLPVAKGGFVGTFEQQYARSMNWTMKKGGISREEIRRQAEKDNVKVTEEQLDEMYKEMRASYVEQLLKGCVAQYLDESKVPALEWERIQHRTIAVPETLTREEIVELIETEGCLDEEQERALKKLQVSQGENGVQIVRNIIAGNIAALGLKEMGEIQEPVHAVIVSFPDPNVTAKAA